MDLSARVHLYVLRVSDLTLNQFTNSHEVDTHHVWSTGGHPNVVLFNCKTSNSNMVDARTVRCE
jgi:hypothetical protein